MPLTRRHRPLLLVSIAFALAAAMGWPGNFGFAAAEPKVWPRTIGEGRHPGVRVSAELSGGVCRDVPRLPKVGAGDARRRLRAQNGGRNLSEPASAPGGAAAPVAQARPATCVPLPPELVPPGSRPLRE